MLVVGNSVCVNITKSQYAEWGPIEEALGKPKEILYKRCVINFIVADSIEQVHYPAVIVHCPPMSFMRVLICVSGEAIHC